jgi:hypothetical protein
VIEQFMLEGHIADSFDAAGEVDPVCGWPLDVHELIFWRDNVPIERFLMLMRMRDYWADANFATSELPTVVIEVQSLIELLPVNNRLVTVLEQFRDACVSAISTQRNLYMICD